jgi:hypothetical protein
VVPGELVLQVTDCQGDEFKWIGVVARAMHFEISRNPGGEKMLVNLNKLRIVTAATLFFCIPTQNNPLEGSIASAGQNTVATNQPIYASPTMFTWEEPPEGEARGPAAALGPVRIDNGFVIKEIKAGRIGYTEKDEAGFGRPRKITYSPKDFSVPTFIVTAVPGSLTEAASACERHNFPVLHMHSSGNMVLCSAKGEKPAWADLVALVQEPEVAEVTPNQEMVPVPDLGSNALAPY